MITRALLPVLFFLCMWSFCPERVSAEENQVDSLLAHSLDQMRAGDLDEAISSIDLARELAEEIADSVLISEIYGYYSSGYRLMEEYDLAYEKGEKSISWAEKLDKPELATRAHNNLGIINRMRGNYEQANSHYQHVNTIAEAQGDSVRVAISYSNMGLVYRNKGALNKALDTYYTALELAETIDDQLTVSSVLDNLGGIYLSLGNYERGLDYYKKRLPVLEATGNRYSKPNLYNNIAYAYRLMGEYDRSIYHYGNAKDLAEELGRLQILVQINSNIASTYTSLNQYERAYGMYQSNMELFDEIESLSLRYTMLNNLSEAYQRQGNYNEAITYAEDALELKKQENNNTQIAEGYLALAAIYRNMGHPEQAYDYGINALEYAADSEIPEIFADVKVKLTRIARDMGNEQKSEEYLAELSSVNESYQTPNIAQKYHRAVVEFKDADYPGYFDSAEAYMNNVERQRDYIQSSPDLRSSFFTNHVPVYKRIAKQYLKNGQTGEAFEIMERTRARVLIEEIQETARKRDIEDEQIIEIQGLRSEITELYEAIERSEAQAERDSLIRLLESRQNEKDRLRASIHRDADSEVEIEPVSYEQVQQAIDPNTAVLSLAEANDFIIAIAFLDDEFETWVIDGDRKNQVDDLLEQFREAIVEEHPVPMVNRIGMLLSNELIEPAGRFIRQAENLLVSADGNLASLPFEALTWNSSYLINEVSVSGTPSFTALKLRDHRSARSYENDIFKLANPEFESHDLDDALVQRSGYRLEPLPASQIEAERIGALFERTNLLSGGDATLEAVNNVDLSQFRYIHFATHGVVNRQFPEMSGLALADDGVSVQYLRSRAIRNRFIPSEMAVLSACETAVGPTVTGEGILGLQRSFLVAGTPTVVASLWRVYDQSTSQVMISFYENLLEADRRQQGWLNWFSGQRESNTQDKAQAMRSAKIAMINSSQYYHPVHWAAFQVVGY